MFQQPIIQAWHDPIFTAADLRVDVLRLDLLHPTISGNKWLKLKGYIDLAKAGNKMGILTKGGPWSNHAHAVAFACKHMGLSCQLWIKGNEKQVTATLQDCIGWQADIRFINRSLFYNEIAASTFADENNLLYIPLGGADETGIASVAKYMTQLEIPEYEYAVCAVGTATTFAGLAFTQNNFNHIIGIESGTKDDGLVLKVKEWQQQMPQKKLSLSHEYSFGGYSKYNNELIDFMNQLYALQKVATDIVYTGKLFYAVMDLAKTSCFNRGSNILVIHSGGLQGNRSLPASILQF